MYFAAVALSQPMQWVQEREDEYLRRMRQYDKDTQALFPEMFAKIILAFETEGFADILGDIYMQLELHNKWKGQFFTPFYISELMAKMATTAEGIASEVEQKGYFSVAELSCGGGAMLIAYAKVAHMEGVNYQRDVLFVGQDIDPVVARMCYISMALLGMPGYVIIGNSLLMDKENWDYWFTSMYFIQGFEWRKQKKTSANVPAMAEVSEQKNAELQITVDVQTREYPENKAGQFTLFPG